MSQSRRFEEITMTESQREAFLERIRQSANAEDYRRIEAMSCALPEILALIEQDPMTMRKLRHLLSGPKTEKTNQVCPAATVAAPAPATAKPKHKGHGRIKARDYTGARWVEIAHPQVKPGDACPLCSQGSVRRQKSKALALRIAGSPPISATGYAMERLRCDTCGEVFTAPTPPQAGTRKYAPSVGVTVALLRYGSGMPHYRLARLQKSLGVPLPESTQWEVMKPLFEQAQPIFEQVIAQAANSPLIHQDDTTMRILAHCLSHGRREFVTVAPSFPNECRHVREALGEVYRVDAQAKEQEMNPEQRLVHHQSHSQPVMEQLQAWMRQQMEDKKVEPNSGLGQAMAYMLKHWEPLTLFLRKAGAPLDNNRCEQALKMAILHRKNSLSYKTLTGARTGDLFMSLIHTCRLNGVNPFEYLLAIATHPDAVKLVPQAWLPWNYPKSGMTPDSS